MSLSFKIYITATIWAILSTIAGVTAYFNLNKTLKGNERITHAQQAITKFNNLLNIMINIETGIRGYLISGDDVYLEPFNASEGLFDSEGREAEKLMSQEPEQLKRIQEIIKTKREWIEGPAVEEMMGRKKLTRGMITYEQFVSNFKGSKGKTLTDRIRNLSAEGIKIEQELIENIMAEHKRSTKMTIYSIAIGLSLGVIIGFILLSLITRNLSKTLKVLLQRVTDATSSILNASQKFSYSSELLAGESAKSAAALEEVVASVELLSNVVEQNSKGAQEAGSLATKNLNVAKDGETEISKLFSAMESLAESSSKITEITSVIDDIAFQTNLLALNAAVEAARAGEQGKGFAVVAEAVRNLSQRTVVAAKDISSLIYSNVEKINSGQSTAKLSNDVLKKILSSIQKMTDLNKEIANSSLDQTNGLQQIKTALLSLDQGTQNNAMLAESNLKSSSDLAQQANQLKEIIDELNKTIEGKTNNINQVGEPR